MQVIFVGGASGVGASCLAIELAGQWIVVDAGIRLDRHTDPLPDLAALQDKPLAAIFVTHAHADHIGALPLLHRAFPAVPLYASRATALLMEVMLADALKIMERRAVEEMELPLYPPQLVDSMFRQLRPLPVGEPVQLPALPGITLHASHAGHIAGAISLGLQSEEGSIVVSGDLSLTPQRTVLGAVPPPFERPDLLVLEATYGARLHPNREAEELRLAQAVAQGIAGGGHVLIPAFGLGRGQEVLLLLQAAQEHGQIPPFPIVVDGLIRKVCAAYSLMPEALTPRLARQLRKGYRPFEGQNVTFVSEVGEREHILQGPPACLVASSGMLTGGPSAWYAARLASDPRASILITGYQDEESPGRRLLDLAEGQRNTLALGGQEVTVACTVGKYSLSAHADGSELASYAAHLHPRRVALVHGDQQARRELRGLLEGTQAVLPQDGDTLDLMERVSSHARETAVVPLQALPSGIGGGALFTAAHVKALWGALRHRPAHQAMTLRELVALWYGDGAIAEHLAWMEDVLENEQPYDEPYFVRHPDLPEAYRVRRSNTDTAEEPLSALVGQVVLLRLQAESAKPVLCRALEPHDTLRVLHPRGEYNDRTRFSLRMLLDVVGPLPYMEGQSERTVLTEVARTARRIRKSLSAHLLARACEENASYTLSQLCEVAGLAVHDLPTRIAVVKLIQQHPRLFVQQTPPLEAGGHACYGLACTYPEALCEPEVRERPDQNWILSVLKRHLGTPPDLVRQSVSAETGEVTLSFFFPEVAQERYQDAMAAAAEETGVSITVAPHTHQEALAEVAIGSLPQGLQPAGRASILLDRRSVRLPCRGQVSQELVEQAQRRFSEQTRWHLWLVVQSSASGAPAASANKTAEPQVVAPPSASTVSSPRDWPLPEQDVLEYARGVLGSLPGYLKVGVNHQTKRGLRVRFIFPDAAQARYGELLAQVGVQTGWRVELHPRPQQEALVEVAQRLLPQGVASSVRPSLYWDERLLSMECLGSLDQETAAQIQRQFAQETGWSLELRRPSLQEDVPARCSQAEAMVEVGVVLSGASDLYQIGADANRGVLWLHFHFPQMARERYAEQLARLAAQTGWRIELHPRVHQKALIEQARVLLPADVGVVGKTSVYQDQQCLSISCAGPLREEDQQEIERRFTELTGWHLEVVRVAEEGSGPHHPVCVVPGRMGEEEALALVRSSLPQAPQRIGVDTVRGVLLLSMSDPPQSAPSGTTLSDLEARTGWQIKIASVG